MMTLNDDYEDSIELWCICPKGFFKTFFKKNNECLHFLTHEYSKSISISSNRSKNLENLYQF